MRLQFSIEHKYFSVPDKTIYIIHFNIIMKRFYPLWGWYRVISVFNLYKEMITPISKYLSYNIYQIKYTSR